jgi:DNA-binding beta-propeller fold protein YncE
MINVMQKLGLVAVVFSLATPCWVEAQDGPYHLLKEIPIGGASSWDYCSVDSAARRLYVSHGTEVEVIDLDKDAVVGTITNTPGVHGIAIAADLGRGVVSDGRENKANIFDLKTLASIAKVDTGANPDGLVYEAGQHEVYLFNGRANPPSATVLDVANAKVTATIVLAGKPEFPAADVKADRVYDNLEDKNLVAVIDTKTHTVVTNWPIAPGEKASGMAIDTAHGRLFLGCDNNKMVMMNCVTGKVVDSVAIGGGVDANAFDPGTQLAFASCGESGTTTIAHEDSPDKLTVVQTLKTESGARTMTLDPTTHKIYLAVGQRNTPNSFKVLVYEMKKP